MYQVLPGNSQSRIRELLLVIFQLYRPKDKKMRCRPN